MISQIDEKNVRLKELAILFLKLGTTAFGGPAAHIAMMENEVVRVKKWISHSEFLDLLGAVNLIPGPNSTEMAIHIGHKRAGWPGLLVAGTCFIMPATLIVGMIAWAYVKFGRLPEATGLLNGVKPVIIAIVLQALWGLGRTAIKTRYLGLICLVDAALAFFGIHELVILFGTGLLIGIAKSINQRKKTDTFASSVQYASPSVSIPIVSGMMGAVAIPFSLSKLFLVFLKIGSVLFGSGYVLLAFLRADLVERFHWLTENQLLDAIAVGQFAPGPVFTTATFIGYILSGPIGAVAATVGIFLPAFFFVAISGPLIPRIRASALAGGFLDGVNIASLALMGVVSWQFGSGTIKDLSSMLIFGASLFLILRFKVNSAWLVLGGAIFGMAVAFLKSRV